MKTEDRVLIENFEREWDLCLAKKHKEIDSSWEDIINELGYNYHPDTIRKWADAYDRVDRYNLTKAKYNSTDEEYEKLLNKQYEVKKLLSELSDLRTLVNKDVREQQRYESLLKILKEEIVRYENDDRYYRKQDFIYSEESMKEMIVMVSDIHYDLEVENEWNVFNPDVALSRMNHLIGRAKEIGVSNNVEIVHLVVNGDLVNGNIHLTSRLSNRENISKACRGVAALISKAIMDLDDTFDWVMVHINSGNHDRICPSKHDNDYDDSYINFIKDYVTIKCENLKNVIFDDNKYGHDISVFNSCGKKIVATHGDKIKPKDMVARYSDLFEKVDYVLRGHVHHDTVESFGQSKVITTSSFSGMDRYAQTYALNSRPEQKIMILQKDSNDEIIYNIDLSKIRK